MANPSKKKGTGGETEVLRILNNEHSFKFTRTPASSTYDLRQEGPFPDNALEVLLTRPDRGEWLATLRLEDFAHMLAIYEYRGEGRREPVEVHAEVKRYVRFALHTIWQNKFGRKA